MCTWIPGETGALRLKLQQGTHTYSINDMSEENFGAVRQVHDVEVLESQVCSVQAGTLFTEVRTAMHMHTCTCTHVCICSLER
jgi:hypothetical protein